MFDKEQGFHMIFKMWILLSPTNLNTTGCPKKISSIQKNFLNFFQDFFKLSCHLWTQFSQLLKGQFGKFFCLSHREFSEVFKTPPNFISSQSGVIAKKPRKSVFIWDTLYLWYIHIKVEPYQQIKELSRFASFYIH